MVAMSRLLAVVGQMNLLGFVFTVAVQYTTHRIPIATYNCTRFGDERTTPNETVFFGSSKSNFYFSYSSLAYYSVLILR